MLNRRLRSLLVAVFSVFGMLIFNNAMAQETDHIGKDELAPKTIEKKEKVFDANEVIFDHVLDAHEFHFLSYKDAGGKMHHVTIPLPVILYSPQKGFSTFMSSAFHHGEHEVDGYRLSGNKIVPVEEGVKVYDISLTRNVVQMLLVLAGLVWMLISIGNKYSRGIGTKKAPTGLQNAVEPVITFIRDEVAIPNLGHAYQRFLPYLLTLFFFILFNTLFGLIPGTANVTGNIAFTAVLGVISFIVISVNGNSHYWGHIFNPPVPGAIKPILVLVEVLGVFTKPFALIIRLFANMVAGHIIIICLISLIFIFGGLNKGIGWGFSPVSIAFSVFIYLIELLVGFIQAFIFT
ncbi:MAG: F0F1 ATP synthase subunit A, partial [Chitinophagaceae bacterium]|nr:F0F1 ATP synthase subunit A [Chitinophagaceae bacterium]